jgi:hypothetical protein
MVFIGWGRGWETCPACGGSQRAPAKGQEAAVARLAVRSDGQLILGKNVQGLLKAGMIYEIVNVLGELVVREVGESCASYQDREFDAGRLDPREDWIPATWGSTPNVLVHNGYYLFTTEEFREQARIQQQAQSAPPKEKT